MTKVHRIFREQQLINSLSVNKVEVHDKVVSIGFQLFDQDTISFIDISPEKAQELAEAILDSLRYGVEQ